MFDASTQIGGGAGKFPQTHWSILHAAGDSESPRQRAAVEELATAYWRPVYAYLRRKWGKSNEEAKDLTQEFFTSLYEREYVGKLSPDQGRFRSYVMTSLDNLVRLQHRHENRKKRGGDHVIHSLEMGEGFEPSSKKSSDATFRQEWLRSILEGALSEMREAYQSKKNEDRFEIFDLHDLNPPQGTDVSYEALAERFLLKVSEIKNILYLARLHLRKKVRERVQATVTTPEEEEAEMNELFGAQKG